MSTRRVGLGIGALVAVVAAGFLFTGSRSPHTAPDRRPSMSVYDFQVKSISGERGGLDQYRGKVLLVVNVASECGFTPQYSGLESLYRKYKDRGFVVLGFPSNQFGGQEPGSDNQIKEFCETRFGVTFPLFSKIDVNGSQADPLFTFLKQEQPGLLGTESIKWNFTKFLVDREGRPMKRYAPQDKPESIESEIEAALAGPA